MVNLSQTATYADATSPEGRAAFDAFYAGLAMRTAVSFKTLHVLANPDELIALDFGVSVKLELPPVPYANREWPCCGALKSESMTDLVTLADAKLALYEPEGIITALPASAWWEFWIVPFVGMGRVMMPHATKGRVFVVLRGVVR